MSDVLNSAVFDHLDHNTRSIVDGFICNATKSFIKPIPKTINYLILMMVDDYFMFDRGFAQWNITRNQQLRQILSAQPGAQFTSDIFSMCGMEWMMKLYPNSNIMWIPGQINLCLQMIFFPSEWKQIIALQTLICHQTNTISRRIVGFSANRSC